MTSSKTRVKRWLLATVLGLTVLPSTGCRLILGLTADAFQLGAFWWTTPLIPVSPYMSQKLEDAYWDEERYAKVPILDPVEGENAPLYCLDPPSSDEVMRTLPDSTSGGVAFLAETSRNNVRIIVEPMVDRLDDCRFVPMVGPARIHHCSYKCTIYFEEVKRSYWPVPFTHRDQRQEVVYVDHDHYIRCAGPDADSVTMDEE
jgi:hypothetical protein